MYADVRMVDTILRNLLSNAIKFTGKEGTIEISAIGYAHTTDLAVTDTGTGIKPDALKKIFRIDAKYSRAGTAGEQGTGLGLILCKELAELNHGTLSVESTLGQGSTFTLTLPNHSLSGT